VVPLKLLTIGYIQPIEGFENRLKLEFDLLKEEGLQATLKKHHKGNAVYYYCYVDDEVLLKENNFNESRKAYFSCVANALSDIIINYWEPKLIKRIIKDNYFYFNKAEQIKIYDFALNMLNYNELSGKHDLSYQIRRKALVLHKILEYLFKNSTIIIDGFVNFRLKDYIEQLEESVDKAIDEYLMDKEYREFIKLLRHFVDLQEPKRDVVNIVFHKTQIVLIDEDCKYIENDTTIDLIAKENPEVNMDDIVVSTLINIAPRRIIIHGFSGKDKTEVVNTLYNIFEGRIDFCHNCDICIKSNPFTKK
jgi:putative sporulation protein YtxC